MTKKYNTLLLIFVTVAFSFLFLSSNAYASPYGDGNYGALVPYGGETSMTISTNGNVAIPITPASGGASNSATSLVTVVSTDVVGYDLYIASLSNSNLTNSVGGTIPASSNGSPAPLAVDTWGYNTDGSSNFVGVSTTNTLLLAYSGPVEAGNTTTVKYGVDVDYAKAAGSYTANVLYTAVPQTN